MMRFLSFTLVAHAQINSSQINANLGPIPEAQSPCNAPCELRKAQDKSCSDGTCGCGIEGCAEGEHQVIAERQGSGTPGVGYCRCYFVDDIGNHVQQEIASNYKRSHGVTMLEDNNKEYISCVEGKSDKCEDGLCRQMSPDHSGKLTDGLCTTTRENEIGVTHMCKCEKKEENETKVEARLI